MNKSYFDNYILVKLTYFDYLNFVTSDLYKIFTKNFISSELRLTILPNF